jgi:single-strand DNA-binding protein
VKKGAKVLVEGKIQTRKWKDNDGNERYSTEIVLGQFDAKLVLLSKREGGGDERQDDPPPPRGDLDDEIPF